MRYLFMAAVLLAVRLAVAAPAGDSQVLSQLLDAAVRNSLSVQAQKFDVDSRDRLVSASTAWSNPQILLEGQKGDDNTAAPINNIKVSLIQPLSVMSLGIKKKIAKVDLALTTHHLEDETLTTKTNTLRWIYAYTVNREVIRLLEERTGRLEIIKKFLATRHYMSQQRRGEAFIVENKIAAVEKEIQMARAADQYLWQRLNVLIDWKNPEQFPSFWFKKSLAIDKQSLLEKTLQHNHDIECAGLESQKAREQHRFERRQALPDIALTGSSTQGRQGNPESNYAIGVAVSVPILSLNRHRAGASEAAVSAAESREALMRQNVTLQFEQIYGLHSAQSELLKKNAYASIQDHGKSMSALVRSFQLGQLDLVTFFEADSTYFERAHQALQIQNEYAQTLADLFLVSGENIDLKEVL